MSKSVPHLVAPRATLAMGAAGALIGGAVAAARNYQRVQHQELSREDAVKDTLKEAGTTGLATATATAVVGALGFTGLVSLVGIVLATAGTKHLADKMLAKEPKAVPAQAATESTNSGKKAKATGK